MPTSFYHLLKGSEISLDKKDMSCDAKPHSKRPRAINHYSASPYHITFKLFYPDCNTTMQTLMSADDMAWECAENISHNWLLEFLKLDIKNPIAMFILQRHRGDGIEFAILEKGSYNVSLRMKYEKSAVVIRLSQPGAVFFPEEKVVNEVAVMRFLIDQTSIPIPFVLDSGTKKESPLELSPFIIMEYIEHKTTMYDALNTPGCPRQERGILDPNIDDNTLELLYNQLASVLLQLSSKPSFPRIGSLTQIDDFT